MSAEVAQRLLIISSVSDRCEANLYMSLAAMGFKIWLVCDPADPYEPTYRRAGISVIVRQIKNRFDLRFMFWLRKFIRSQPIDVIYAPTSRGLTAANLVCKRKPLKIVSYRGTLGHLAWWDPAAQLAHLNKRVDMIVCNCCAVQEFLKNQCQVDPDRLTVIYKGHETEWYQPKVDFDLHALLGISPDTLIAGCFANIRPVKGIDVLVRSFDLLRDLKDLHLVLVGSIGDPNLQSLVAQFNLQDRIHFLGFRSDVPDIMSRCQFTVMPSVDREGVPRAVVESLSLSIPVIASSVGGIPELIEDGVSGLLVPPRDTQQLANAIRRMALDFDFRTASGRRGFSKVSKMLSTGEYVTAYANLFRS